MRDISFKAKRLDNKEWIEGDLIGNAFYRCDTESDCCYILDYEKMKYYDFQDIWEQLDEYEVDPETVCQFTGLKDCNKNRIFEGDIVKVRDPYSGCWSINGGEVIFSTEYVGGWVITSNGEDGLNIGTRTNDVDIIGNIYDNPELLLQ